MPTWNILHKKSIWDEWEIVDEIKCKNTKEAELHAEKWVKENNIPYYFSKDSGYKHISSVKIKPKK